MEKSEFISALAHPLDENRKYFSAARQILLVMQSRSPAQL
jgi:hypothetical protein